MEIEKESALIRAGKSFDSLLNRVTNIMITSTGFLILLMALVYTYGSLKRYIFISPDAFAYVGVSVLMLIIGIAPLAGVQMLRQHISVDFMVGRFPKIVREFIVYVLGPLMGLVFCIALVYTSWNEAMYALQMKQHLAAVTSVYTFPFKLLVPIFAGLLCLVLIAQIVNYLASFRRGLKAQQQ
jgi:TRAP-type mannitol/chloroaromatic compound transport system permease small subunit